MTTKDKYRDNCCHPFFVLFLSISCLKLFLLSLRFKSDFGTSFNVNLSVVGFKFDSPLASFETPIYGHHFSTMVFAVNDKTSSTQIYMI